MRNENKIWNKLYTIAVTLFWLTMVGLLFQKEVLPTFIIANPAGYKIELTKDIPVRESWMGIYFKDKKIGFSNTVISQDVDRGIAGYRINEAALLRLNMLGRQKFIRIRGSSFLSENYRLKSFDYKLISAEHRFEASGYVEDDNLKVEIDISGDRIKKIFKIKPNTLISNSISPILLFKRPDKDKEINFEIFDPVTFGTNKGSIKNIGKETLEFNKIRYETYIFEVDISGIKTKTWMTKDGDILKEESLLGFTMYKEGPEYTLDSIRSLSFGTEDLISEFSLSSDVEILDPREVSYLKIDKNGVIVEIFKDSLPLEENILFIPIEEIPEEDFIQSKDKRIVELARQIIGDEKNSWIASTKILYWVYYNLEKAPALSVPSSLGVLCTMRGDCNEHTVLFTALTRSLGIPTKMVAGLVYLEKAFYYHVWPKVYVGEWVNMDPTLGQEITDATHIPLLEGGLKEQLQLIRIIGDLKIKVVDFR